MAEAIEDDDRESIDKGRTSSRTSSLDSFTGRTVESICKLYRLDRDCVAGALSLERGVRFQGTLTDTVVRQPDALSPDRRTPR